MPVQLITGLLLAGLIGVSLGLLGGGGSTITVPLLVYVIGITPHEAVGVSLAVVSLTSLVGALLHYREGNVELRAAFLFSLSGLFSAYFGSALTPLLSGRALLLAFSALMIVVGLFMLKKRSGAKRTGRLSIARSLAAGAVVGLLTGILGVGGGFLIVPALVLFAGLPMHAAVGTSLVVISVNAFSGALGHLGAERFDLRLALLVALPAVAGTLFGTRLAQVIAPDALRKGFALFVILIGGAMAVANA